MVDIKEIVGLSVIAFCTIGLLTLKTVLSNKTFNKIAKYILNIFPLFVLFFIPINLNTIIWIVGITLAYSIIEINQIIGIVLYLLVYGFVGVISLVSSNSYCYLSLSLLLTITIVVVFMVLFGKQVSKLNISAMFVTSIAFYVAVSFISLFYTFFITNNYAFLILILSDILIGCKYVLCNDNKDRLKLNKILSYIILVTFYIGVIYSSISIPFIK